MASSIRIIQIVKAKNPIDNSEEEMYTVEVEVETDDAGKLAVELAKSPYGEQIVDMLARANFLPTKEQVLQKSDEELELHDKEITEAAKKECREEMLDKIIEYLREHDKSKTAKAIEKIFDDEVVDSEADEETDEEDTTDGNSNPIEGIHP